MKRIVICISVLLGLFFEAKSQGTTESLRGPVNVLSGGVIDGVAVQDEVPVRVKLEYEYVRASDVTWQKRVFSRIDSRELMNHPIFFPNDAFSEDYNPLVSKSSIGGNGVTASAPQTDENWLRNSSRWSLWTIIRYHVMSGDLTVFRPSSEFYPDIEDGYSFKYPIEKANYYTDANFRDKINPFLSLSSDSVVKTYKPYDVENKEYLSEISLTKPADKSLQDFINLPENKLLLAEYNDNPAKFQSLWNSTAVGQDVKEPGKTKWIASNSIVAYYIKEDWYFDKERSIMDKRIIAIAPVVHYQYVANSTRRTIPIIYDENNVPTSRTESVDKVSGNAVVRFDVYKGQMEERELFWLYFDELRNVLVNYYVYNEKNDAQWMSFDDLFWKRRFTATIYRASDKFDREVEDYKFGVDALYEAEKMRESIRNWEHDLWHF